MFNVCKCHNDVFLFIKFYWVFFKTYFTQILCNIKESNIHVAATYIISLTIPCSKNSLVKRKPFTILNEKKRKTMIHCIYFDKQTLENTIKGVKQIKYSWTFQQYRYSWNVQQLKYSWSFQRHNAVGTF